MLVEDTTRSPPPQAVFGFYKGDYIEMEFIDKCNNITTKKNLVMAYLFILFSAAHKHSPQVTKNILPGTKAYLHYKIVTVFFVIAQNFILTIGAL